MRQDVSPWVSTVAGVSRNVKRVAYLAVSFTCACMCTRAYSLARRRLAPPHGGGAWSRWTVGL